jgi:hypothetical protein
MSNLHLIVPVTLILTLGSTAGFIFFMSYRTSRKKLEMIHNSIKLLVESNQQITPELLEKVAGKKAKPGETDLRRGVVSIAMGISICVFGMFVSGFDNVNTFAGISSIPIILGLAYLCLWKFSANQN